MSRRLALGWMVSGTVLVVACAHAGFVPQPSALDVERIQPLDPGLSLEEMQVGRATYLSRCSSCHPVHGPADYRGDQWPALVARMQREKKVKIPEHDRMLMERYLIAFSSTAPKADAGVPSGAVEAGSLPAASR